MFLINSLIQHRKFAGPFLLPVYRMCKKIMLVHYVCHNLRNFRDIIFYSTPLERGALTVLLRGCVTPFFTYRVFSSLLSVWLDSGATY